MGVWLYAKGVAQEECLKREGINNEKAGTKFLCSERLMKSDKALCLSMVDKSKAKSDWVGEW